MLWRLVSGVRAVSDRGNLVGEHDERLLESLKPVA
jgi:hypothetical protein